MNGLHLFLVFRKWCSFSVVPAFSICSLLLFLRILSGTYIGGTKGMVSRLPFFENKKSAPILEKNTLTVLIYGPNISFQILSLRVKHPKIFWSLSLVSFNKNVYQSAIIPRNLTHSGKFLVASLVVNPRFEKCVKNLILTLLGDEMMVFLLKKIRTWDSRKWQSINS